jgi:hypothetical protein
VAANRMDLGYHSDIEIRRRGNRRPHPCQTGSNDKNVVLFHRRLHRYRCVVGVRTHT